MKLTEKRKLARGACRELAGLWAEYRRAITALQRQGMYASAAVMRAQKNRTAEVWSFWRAKRAS